MPKTTKTESRLIDDIRSAGWFINYCEDGTFQVKDWHGDPDDTGPFQTIREARDWAVKNPITLTNAAGTHSIHKNQMPNPSTPPPPINLRTELIEFAQATLATLQTHREWDADTTDQISNYALDRGLAKLDANDDDMFKVLPAADNFHAHPDRKGIVQALAELRQECDKHGWDFGALDRKAYQQYLESKGPMATLAKNESQVIEYHIEPAARRRMRI